MEMLQYEKNTNMKKYKFPQCNTEKLYKNSAL